MEWVGVFNGFRKGLGFVLLLSASLYFLADVASTDGWSFVQVLGLILLLFAWTDYMSLIIYPAFGMVALGAFFLGNLDGLFSSLPMLALFTLFAALLSTDRERWAFRVFLLSIPVAFISSYLWEESSPVSWAMVGLMLGYVENAVVEEMAEGDVYILALYFMALGPLGFIPFALQRPLGILLYSIETEEGILYPVGPGTFVVSVPILVTIKSLVSSGSLPGWLFFAHQQGIPNSTAVLIGGAIGLYIATHYFLDVESLLGAMAGLSVGIITFVLIGLIALFLGDHGHTIASIVLFIFAFFYSIGAAYWAFDAFSKLHYHGGSSIDPMMMAFGSLAGAIALAMLFMLLSWGLFQSVPGVIPSTTGLAIVGMLYLYTGRKLIVDENGKTNWMWSSLYVLAGFLAGFLAGIPLGVFLEWL
ncbi:hypothetical protein A3L11_08535 [Thermococcus siculi]|uniref:Uncharacterized protein n=1 Tax=Thermococcus siculi TaxID=72803 RepID=A0A2Z2MLM1_9EURY|nr:hypothetical protein [Thermococcus siculi]ASJ09272.1 hypothetical protein A3L11_08535 [Thermococcus siculi]